MAESEKEVISFYLSKSLTKELDKCAASMGMNRSVFLEWLLSKALPSIPVVARLMEDVFKSGLNAEKKRKR